MLTRTVLVVGGAGYIGSHMVQYLLDRGCRPVTFDNLSSGFQDAVAGGEFVQADLGSTSDLKRVFSAHAFDAVMHFASYIQVGESVRAPGRYYRNNVANTINLLDAMVTNNVKHLVFSSSAAVYGEPQYTPLDENHPLRPANPYGRTKQMVEEMLSDYGKAHDLRSVALRYFNAAGADPQGRRGERHQPETHLIPLALQAASGRGHELQVFGRDYDTPDGTCIRDYIHVEDLCDAHWLALQQLWNGCESTALNLGNGDGFSVQEVINAARAVTRRDIPVVDAPRRPGDVARLVADASLLRRLYGWRPKYGDLIRIIEDAWRWELAYGKTWK